MLNEIYEAYKSKGGKLDKGAFFSPDIGLVRARMDSASNVTIEHWDPRLTNEMGISKPTDAELTAHVRKSLAAAAKAVPASGIDF